MRRKPQLKQAHIKRLSHDGRGITEINGKTTFVSQALPDEEVEFYLTRQKSNYGEGICKTVLHKSTKRVEAKCEHFSQCGGCSMQHLSSEDQINHKQMVLLEQINHQAKVNPINTLPALTAKPWHYRRKARLGIRYVEQKGGTLLGFRERLEPRFITPASQCQVLHPTIQQLMQPLSELINQLDNPDKFPQIEVASADNGVGLIIRHLAPLSDNCQQKIIAFAKEHQVTVYLQPEGLDSIHPIYPEKPQALYYELQPYQIRIEFHPTDFIQVNAAINQAMVARAIELLDLQPDDRLLDLFSGLGNFSLPIAKQVKQVTAVEGDELMVARAEQNARINGITNLTNRYANLYDEQADLAALCSGYDKILLDPPRTGAEAIVKLLAKSDAKRIVYVSCDPATLARDSAHLIAGGYKLNSAGVMDMFPHTSHVESIALFER